jgi:predicted O-methyltransferase YrrM
MVTLDFPESQLSDKDESAIKDVLYRKCPKVIGELGVWAGRTTKIFAEYAKANNAKVYCIDHFNGNEGTYLNSIAIDNNIRKIFINNMQELGLIDYIDLICLPSIEASYKFADDYFDMFYIDADHRYSSVSNDLSVWFPKVKSGGLIGGHDFEGFEYSEDDINKDFSGGRHNGVIKAVTEKFNNVEKISNTWWANK